MTLDEARALDAADPLAHCRGRFRLPPGKVYLDGNSLGALPAASAARLGETVEAEWGEALIESWNKHDWIGAPERLAVKLAPLVGAGPDELLIADSTSINLFKLLAAALAASPGRSVILSEEGNFPTDLYVAQGLEALIPGTRLKPVDRGSIESSLDEQVAVLMLTQVDYRSGRRHDMKAINGAAHRAGALTLWDLSHSAGAFAVNLVSEGCDLAVGCGYKYLNGGPGAPAFLFVARDPQDQLANPIPGWMGHAEPFAFDPLYRPAPGIARFHTGTPSILALAALEAGLATFDGVSLAQLEAKSRSLTELFVGEAERRCGEEVRFASPRDPGQRGSHLVFSHPHGYAVMQALIARGVIGDFREPNLMRFGFAPLYNSHEEAWRAAEALGDILATREWDQPRHHARNRVT
ncbi:MAG TPA: kynureninase [Sphingomicrobium sp.]|nr:kynureninase [Sphingomicrobium sp.]